MAPSTKVEVSQQTKPQPSTQNAHAPSSPSTAPTQTTVTTAEGMQPKTAATFNQNPTLKPNPPDNGSTNIISTQPQPAPKGPATAAQIYGGQGQ